jgi:threonine dehydrogenase-like Zn-dependent dehydrogenase
MPYKKTVAIGKAFHNYGRGIAPLPNPCTGCIACSVQDPAVCLEQLLDVQRKLHHGKNGAFARMLARVNAGDDSHILQPLEG